MSVTEAATLASAWSRLPVLEAAVAERPGQRGEPLGFWLWLGSLSPGLVLPCFVVAIERRFIRREEAHLEERFGERFRTYRASVRRWL